MKRDEANAIYCSSGIYQYTDLEHVFRVIRGVAAHGMGECDFKFKDKRNLRGIEKRLKNLGYSVWVKADKTLNIDWS